MRKPERLVFNISLQSVQHRLLAQACCSGLVAAISLVFTPNAVAQVSNETARQRKEVLQILTQRDFRVAASVPPDRKQFCSTFFNDFRSGRDTEFIEPAATGETYDAPTIQPYRLRCPDVSHFSKYVCEPKVADSIEQLSRAEHAGEYEALCQRFQGTTSFKIYIVDINNNPKDGIEHVFYYERALGPVNRPQARQIYIDGGYAVYDMNRCEARGVFNSHDHAATSASRANNHNGLIRYRANHYLFDLYPASSGNQPPANVRYTLRLAGYAGPDAGGLKSLGTICSFSGTAPK